MSALPTIIIPRSGETSKPYRSPDKRWEEVTQQMYGSTELPENTLYIHVVDWDKQFWSIQNANDQWNGKRIGFWTLIGFVWIVIASYGFSKGLFPW